MSQTVSFATSYALVLILMLLVDVRFWWPCYIPHDLSFTAAASPAHSERPIRIPQSSEPESSPSGSRLLRVAAVERNPVALGLRSKFPSPNYSSPQYMQRDLNEHIVLVDMAKLLATNTCFAVLGV